MDKKAYHWLAEKIFVSQYNVVKYERVFKRSGNDYWIRFWEDVVKETDKYLMTVEHDYQEFHLTMPVYLCSVINGNLELKEYMDSKWVKIEELSKMDFADADKKIVTQLLQKSRSIR